MKILLLSRYGRLGASSRIRSYQYLPYLKAQGIDVAVTPLLGEDYIQGLYAGSRRHLSTIFGAYLRRLGYLLKSHRFDLVWVEKEILPWLPSWGEAFLNYISIPFVVDYDDAVFHRYDLHHKGVVRTLLRRKIKMVMRWSSLVIAGSNYLAEYARRAGTKQVAYLPTVIDMERYPARKSGHNDTFTIGWIGTPITAKYLSLVHSSLAEVCKDGHTRVVLVGGGQVLLEGVPTEIREWSEQTEVIDIQSFDVGIMPLPGTPWERGKCGYKLIQYMAAGVPVIASPVGVNREIVENGINGFWAATPEDWASAIRTLREDTPFRPHMGRAGRDKIKQQYCIQVTAPRLLTLLQDVVKGNVRFFV